jgi:hypothetical protein
MVEFVNPNTMNNAKGEATVVNRLQELDFVVNKPSVKNQPVYDLSVHLSNSIARTAYLQVKTRGKNNPAGYRIGSKKGVQRLADWLQADKPQNYFFVMVDFYKGGSIHVLPLKIFIDEVMGWANHYLSQPKRDGTPRKDTGAWTFEPKWSTKAYEEAKENWDVITSYLEGK